MKKKDELSILMMIEKETLLIMENLGKNLKGNRERVFENW